MKVCSYIVLGRLLVGFLQNGRYLSPYERPEGNPESNNDRAYHNL